MNEQITWDFDLKRILLGNKYKEDNPILNILLAQNEVNHEDCCNDYPSSTIYKNKRGHLENYFLVEKVFQKKYGKSSQYKDIMNSFWHTYKFLLQFEYPDIFTPIGNIYDKKPLEKRNGDFKEFKDKPGERDHYAPFKKPPILHEKYIEYYRKNFPKLKIKKDKNLRWDEFLLDNFDYFDKVHNREDLKTFAKLTHTIGNIDIVPKGFNVGRNNYDYWDWGLQTLKESFSPSEWKKYIDNHELNDYVDNYDVIPFWENHLDPSKIIPENSEDIIKFLKKVNSNIENRGKNIVKKLENNDGTSIQDY